MKITSVLLVMVLACLVGCENPELATCQQEKQALQTQADTLQQQLDDASMKIDALKAKNTEDQNLALQSITTMMEKQAAADEKMQKQLTENQTQVKDLKAQNRIQQQRIEELEKQIAEQKAADEVSDTATEDTM